MQTAIDFQSLAEQSGYLCFDVEYNPDTSPFHAGFQIHGCGFSTLDGDVIVKEYVTDIRRISSIIEYCFPRDIEIIAHSAKGDINCLKSAGIYPCDPKIRCSLVAENLLDDNIDEKQLGLKPTILRNYDYKMQDFMTAFKYGMDSPEFRHYAEDDAYWELKLYLDQRPRLKPFWGLYTDILMPALICFADMETFGIYWNQETADNFYRKLFMAKEKLLKQIYSKIGKINIDSPKQLSNRLFGELGYSTKHSEQGKSGNWSLDATTLDQMSRQYEVCNWIRAYRSCQKLIGSYLEPCQRQYFENKDNRIHSNYWQASKTGRTRCAKVNNQNFPVRVGDDLKELSHIFDGIKIREACSAPVGRKLVVGDFSQIELRLAGHVMGEPDFINSYCDWSCHSCGSSGSSAKIEHKCPSCGIDENEKLFKIGEGFWHGRDLHSEVLQYIPSEVRSKLTRHDGKTLNFAIAFYATCWRLHYEYPQLSPDEWQIALDAIMKNRKAVKRFHEKCIHLLKNKGEIEDCFGRLRRVPKSQYTVKGKVDPKKFKHACNEIINAPIQGGAANLCQLAMVKLRKHWIEKSWWGTTAFLVNMVHDELVAEVAEEHADEAAADMQYWMENAAEFVVPIRAEVGIYDDWSQAK